jgi:DNA-binding transcriptional MocR family regulator
MERYRLRPYALPEHGLFIWARFDDLEDTAALASAAAGHDITLAPGNIFRPHQEPSPWMRFNIAYCNDKEIFEYLARSVDELTGAASA